MISKQFIAWLNFVRDAYAVQHGVSARDATYAMTGLYSKHEKLLRELYEAGATSEDAARQMT